MHDGVVRKAQSHHARVLCVDSDEIIGDRFRKSELHGRKFHIIMSNADILAPHVGLVHREAQVGKKLLAATRLERRHVRPDPLLTIVRTGARIARQCSAMPRDGTER